ncbi:hypothetical protein NDU88_006867 [Pleurodeles waltl]|uniref:Uncharacterized protein n=1 Tax=Pleurodeles waltl TaxID=8319 RepID=A0AAV7UMA3_PLEWA|nr:hypothetical protein NDU88_006867 [Pleurodeles waltl]
MADLGSLVRLCYPSEEEKAWPMMASWTESVDPEITTPRRPSTASAVLPSDPKYLFDRATLPAMSRMLIISQFKDFDISLTYQEDPCAVSKHMDLQATQIDDQVTNTRKLCT